MKIEQKVSAKSMIYFVLLVIMLHLGTQSRSIYEGIRPFGDVCITITMFVMLIHLAKSWMDQGGEPLSLKTIYIPIVLLIAVSVFGYVHGGDEYIEGFGLLRVLLLWLFILGAAAWRFRTRHIQIAGLINGIVLIIFLVRWSMDDFDLVSYKGLFFHENYYAVLLYSMFFFSVLAIRYSHRFMRIIYLLLALGNLALIYATSARSVVIGILITACAWILLKLFRRIFRYLFYIMLAGNLLFITVYIGLKDTALGNYLNDLSRMVFHKNLFSGRIEIWESVFHAIMEKPFFGFGVGVKASDVTAQNLTAHNFYLQMLIENGIFGLLFMLLILFGIWKLLNRHLHSFAAKWSACFMLGILVYENLELTMSMNNYTIALFQWFIITFGIGFALDVERPEDEEIDRTRAGVEEAETNNLEKAFNVNSGTPSESSFTISRRDRHQKKNRK